MFSIILKRIRNPVISNSFYLYVSYFSDYLLGLFILPFIARILGAEELGKIGLAQTFGIFIILFVEFGFPLMATKKVATIKNNIEKLKLFMGQVFTFKLLLIPIVFIISILIIFLVPVFYLNPHYIVIITLGSVLQGLAPTWYFQGIQKMKEIALSKTLFRFFGFIIIIIFVKSPKDGWIVLAAYSFSSILICLYLFTKMLKICGTFNLSNVFGAKKILDKSKYSFLTTIIPIVYQNANSIILSISISPLQLGFYYGMTRIYRAFNTLYGPIGQAFYPRLVSINYNNPDNTKYAIMNFLWIMIVIGIVFFGIIILFSKQIIIFLLGKAFLPANTVLKLYAIVLPLTAISHVLGRQWLIILNKDLYYAIIQCTSSIIGFIIMLSTISKYGILSVPISLICFELISIGMILFFYITKNEKLSKTKNR